MWRVYLQKINFGSVAPKKPVMMSFKAFHSAEGTLVGIELCRMLNKGQYIEAKNSSVFEQFMWGHLRKQWNGPAPFSTLHLQTGLLTYIRSLVFL
jgi:hypothetical protein